MNFRLLPQNRVFEKLIEPTLIQPTFVTHLPKELVPLAKLSPDGKGVVGLNLAVVCFAA